MASAQSPGTDQPVRTGPPIAYTAGEFPTETQTFIYREVRALRERGWSVQTVSLNLPVDLGAPGLRDLEDGTVRVYGSGGAGSPRSTVTEFLAHPIQTLRTLSLAVRDAMAPGEPMRPIARLKLLGQAIAGIGLAGRLRGRGIRLMHCHFAHSPATIGMYAARQLKIPFSFTGHANDLFQRRSLLRRKLERAAFVSCISHWHKTFYQEAAPDAHPNYRLIRCGVDLQAWKPGENGHAASNGKAGPLRVLTVCRVVRKKGVDLLIRALVEMNQKRKCDWILTVAGDGPEVPLLKTLAGELGCEANIAWLGMVTNDRVPELFAASDVFVLACRTDSSGDRDGIPVALMESMACGVPVISGDLPSIRELIDDGVSGMLVDQMDTPQGISRLADCLADLATDPVKRASLVAAGRRRVEEEFSLNQSISVLAEALTEAAA